MRHLSISKFQIWQHSDVVDSYIDYIERGILLEKMFILYYWSKIKILNLEESIYTNNNVS